mmetsp:Transcript_774/g.1209  ORF Transcript_774/g.1209 Transcript_774/m.1209 type:complete len:249 (+) Transcript_774:80-826(+)
MHEIPDLPDHCPWSSWRRPNLNWCEAHQCGYIVTVANSWSNLAYAVAAYLIYQRVKNAKGIRSAVVAQLLSMFPIATFIVGLFSFAYHASYTYVFQWFDFLGMFIFLALPIALNFEVLGHFKGQKGWNGLSAAELFYFQLVVVASLLVFVLHALDIKFQLLIVVGIITLLVQFSRLFQFEDTKQARRPLAFALMLIAAAGLCSFADQSGLYCRPESWLQGHSLWHLLSASSLVALVDTHVALIRALNL